MISVVRSGLRLAAASISNSVKQTSSQKLNRTFSSVIWNPNQDSKKNGCMHHKLHFCSCSIRKAHSEANASCKADLVDFLNEEISGERKVQKNQTIPSVIDEFKVRLDGSDVILTKEGKGETIQITFNINHSVGPSSDADMQPGENPEDTFQEMKSHPEFEIKIKKGNSTLGFLCAFIEGQQSPAESETGEADYADVFSIQEVKVYEGEWKDKNYAVSAEVIDGYLYDLLMNFLEERGISNEFVDKMCQLSTDYEHATYINFLGQLKKFVS